MAYTKDNKFQPTNIKYTSKDFTSIKEDLINYTKTYFPDTYRDFNETSPGMMLIELTSYVGDVLSYYIDYQYKESLLSTATEKRNILNLAEFLGYKYNNVSPSMVELKITKEVDADSNDTSKPTKTTTLIDPGFQIKSSADSELIFETLDYVDFQNTGSYPQPTVELSAQDANGIATKYKITHKVNAISGETKTKTFTLTSPTKFLELDLGESNVVEVLNCVDSSGQKWYEVDYLAQNRILKETHYSDNSNQSQIIPDGESDVAVPFSLEYINTNKKFVRKVDVDTNNTKLQFGNGLYRYNVSGSAASFDSILQQQGINVAGVPLSNINSGVDNLVKNNTINLGETPANTILTVTYRVGGGALSNAQSGEITEVVDTSKGVTVTNDIPAIGGADGFSEDEIRENAKSIFASQLRCVTKEDYQARIMNMPAKFGNVAKAYVERGSGGDTLVIRTLSYNKNKQLVQTPFSVLKNLQRYLDRFKIINDNLDFGIGLNGLNISGHYINFGVEFDVNYDRRFNPKEIKVDVIDVIKKFFSIEKMQFKQSINLNDLEYDIIGLDGVIGISELKLTNQFADGRKLYNLDKDGNVVTGGSDGYGFFYDFQNDGIQNKILRPSVTPSVFEIRNPNTDIIGKVR